MAVVVSDQRGGDHCDNERDKDKNAEGDGVGPANDGGRVDHLVYGQSR